MVLKSSRHKKETSLSRQLSQKLFSDSPKKRKEKSKILTTSIPSYFNRHFRNMPDSVPASDSLKRFSSPQPPKPSKDLRPEEIPKIQQDVLMTQLLRSNGLELYKIVEANYRYFVGPGNNDSLVTRILRGKPGWSKSFSPHSANLIWTDVKKTPMIDLVPRGNCMKKNVLGVEDKLNEILDNEIYRALETTSTLSPLKVKVYNKLEGNSELASKKKLLSNMQSFYLGEKKDPFLFVPLSFHVVNGSKDTAFKKIVKAFQDFEERMKGDELLNNLWIVKPGEATNRGIGIKVCGTIEEIALVIDEVKVKNNVKRTYIVQKYLYRPMLYKNRKFDIRCYVLVTVFNNNIQSYLYKEGYLRTSCSEFSLNQIDDKFIHLTNDAVQKHSPDYGKFEDGNKLSYSEYQDYLDSTSEKFDFKSEICPKIKSLVQDSLKATWKSLDPQKRFHCFEIFGYDFMVDEMLNPWLIEVNTNPCLALSGRYLTQLIPNMLKHSFEITLNQLFPSKEKICQNNLYELVFAQVLNMP